jgi:hypothetical protein
MLVALYEVTQLNSGYLLFTSTTKQHISDLYGVMRHIQPGIAAEWQFSHVIAYKAR